MPRQIRIEYPGAIYHVMSRGDRREAIVCEDGDRELWIRTLGEACAKTAGQALQGREVAILRTDPYVPSPCSSYQMEESEQLLAEIEMVFAGTATSSMGDLSPEMLALLTRILAKRELNIREFRTKQGTWSLTDETRESIIDALTTTLCEAGAQSDGEPNQLGLMIEELIDEVQHLEASRKKRRGTN
jgi:hypothetical protein